MAKCPLCESRTAERFCPALGKKLCSICCGEHRQRSIGCPPDCQYLVAALRKRREKLGRELSKEWNRFTELLREKEGHLVPLLEILREALANGLHRLDATDAEVIAALEYCAQRLSPIELLERPPNILGRALEETLVPLVQSGKLDRELAREALRALADFVEHFTRGSDGARFVEGLLGIYPPPPKRPSPIVRPEGPGIIRPDQLPL
ncbi:MAG: hypothetical protein GXO72_02910 [Caldiserica bacterium]|nr:hypothetical protein [Caldisericota bacterium]